MKPPACLLASAAALLAWAHPLRAEEPRPVPAAAAMAAPAAQGKWSVRLEVLMVALPEDKALALLPDLQDPAKIDAACGHLMEAVQRKEAKLTGYPMATALDGQAVSSDTRQEKIYPTQFQPPQTPTAFESRRLGPQLQANCQVSPGGDSIRLQLEVKRVELLGFDTYDTGMQNKDGTPGRIGQPQFFMPVYSGSLGLHNGQRVLLGVHRSVKPEGDMEFFVLHASASPLP